MKTITFLDHTDSTNWPVDETVHFKMYGWYYCKLGCVPDIVQTTNEFVKETYDVEYKLQRFKDIDKSKPWFIFLYTSFQYRLNFESRQTEGKQLFQGIPDDVINELVNGNAQLILSCENEAITNTWFELFYDLYKNNPIVPFDKITYVTAAHNIHTAYKTYCDKNNVPNNEKINIWYSHHGWLSYVNQYIKIYTDALPAGPRDKKFISLNRVPRSHRAAFASLLAEYDLLKHGYVSLGLQDTGWPSTENLLRYIENQLVEWYEWEPNSQVHTDAVNGSKKLLENLPLTVDTNDLVFNWVGYETQPIMFLQKSYFSVVTGTNCFKKDEQGVTVNEKEFKVILSKHPFLLIARPNTLTQLKQMGFKTFDQWFDESYDTEENDSLRLLKVTKEVERLCHISNEDWDKMLEEMRPITEHNFDWLANHTQEMCFNYTELTNLLKYAV